MQTIDAPPRLIFESRSISARVWWVWGLLFLPGLLALLVLPESARFVGLVVWVALWLASLLLLPRWLGDRVQVVVDQANRQVIWQRNNQVTRQVAFKDLKGFAIKKVSIAARPYTAFQLVALLRENAQITLAVDPQEKIIQNGLALAQKYWR